MQRLMIFSLCVLAGLSVMACGDGAFKRALTVSGVYSVKRPDGYPVVCFIEAKGGGIDCVPLKDMVEPEKPARK